MLFGNRLLEGQEKEQAIARIRELGGFVNETGQGLEIGMQLKGRQAAARAMPWISKLEEVVWLNLADSNIRSQDLVYLKKLTKLKWLHLEKTGIDDKGLNHLEGLEELEYLNVYATGISDASLDRLAALPKLKKLYLWQTRVTDQGIQQLRQKRKQMQIVQGIDLSQLAANFPKEKDEPPPVLMLDWMSVQKRTDAPQRSDNGVNCQVWFENRSSKPVKLFWIGYGAGELKLYTKIRPGETWKQNSYSRNVWLITNLQDQPLGYFVVPEDNSRAIIPKDAVANQATPFRAGRYPRR
ncbi:MAG: hypothetical protein VX768_16480 [Planctomycetota bacterium]|nr:hypothetical protein [Planctomycetota bacterium]